MVFTVRHILGIYLVLISCSAIRTASLHSRSKRETSETQVPKYESQYVATTEASNKPNNINNLNDRLINNTKTEIPSTTTTPTTTTTNTSRASDVTSTEGPTITTEIEPILTSSTSSESKTVTIELPTTVETESEEVKTEAYSIATSIDDNLAAESSHVKTEASFKLAVKNVTETTAKKIATMTESAITTTNLRNDTTEKEVIGETKQQARTENGRSLDFDISKYTSSEFHNKNNVYNLPTSPENEKYISSDFDFILTTAKPTGRPRFTNTLELTTPVSEYFDTRFHRAEHGFKQDLEDHFSENQTPKVDKPTSLNDIIEKAQRNNTDSNLDFLRYTSVLSDNKESKNSINKNYETEQRLKINFDSVYNDTKTIDEQILITTMKPITLTTATSHEEKEKFEKVNFITTTRRNLPTKFSLVNKTLDQNSLLNNKIETETIKSVDRPNELNTKSNDESVNDSIRDDKEYKKYPSENAINVSKRGSTKFIENESVITTSSADIEKHVTTVGNADKNDTNINNAKENATTVNKNKNETEVSEQNMEENNIYAFVVTTNPPEVTTPQESAATTETLYEITDEKFLATTDSVDIESTTSINNQSTISGNETTKPTFEATTDEVFYEMTTETTTLLSVATTEPEILPTTEDTPIYSERFITEAQNNDSSSSDSVTEESFSTSTESSKSSESSSSSSQISTESYEAFATENSSQSITSEVTTEIIEVIATKNISSTINSTSATTNNISDSTTSIPNTGINTTEAAEDDDDDDDEYIDFTHRKLNNTSGGNEEIDVINHEAPEVTTATSTVTTSNSTTSAPLITYMDIDSITSTTIETTTEHEEPENVTEGSTFEDPDESNDGTIIAIVISTIGAICLVSLAVLLFIMRRRQKKFSYGQRCTPVSLDSYSMDNVSVYNSVRRKTTIRDSKRSYGNPAFDDATVSHPLNFQVLVKFASNLEEIAAEFEAVPLVTARMSELPEGCELKNRYANVIPLPETRVVLTPTEDDPTSDYINANFVTGPKGVRGYYIACQAPLSNTVNDFWRMIWEQQSRVILMLTHLFETGVEKCVDYLPPSEVLDCHRLFGDYQITLKKREVKDKYIISSLQLKNMVTNSWREVTHFWYSGWPAKGVPSEENSIIAFLIEARSYVKLVQNSTDSKIIDINNGLMTGDVSPVVVHCSPGTGRTGTVLACDIAIREFELKRLVDIPRIVYRIRRDRASSVQTKDQYTFIYRVINLYATKLTGGALDSI